MCGTDRTRYIHAFRHDVVPKTMRRIQQALIAGNTRHMCDSSAQIGHAHSMAVSGLLLAHRLRGLEVRGLVESQIPENVVVVDSGDLLGVELRILTTHRR